MPAIRIKYKCRKRTNRGITMKSITGDCKILYMKSFVLFLALLAISPAVSYAPDESNDILFQPSVITALMPRCF